MITTIAQAQYAVANWVAETFNSNVLNDPVERRLRFLEEALELAQACGSDRAEIELMCELVFSRDPGEKGQEVAGSLITMMALAHCHHIDMHEVFSKELHRINSNKHLLWDKGRKKPAHLRGPSFGGTAT